FVRLVSAHGLLELSCIAVGGAAGLRVGWALLHPGVRRRGAVLVEEARNAVEIAAGTAPFLVICGLAEGFLTGPGLPVAVQGGRGVLRAAASGPLVAWRGQTRAAPSARGRPPPRAPPSRSGAASSTVAPPARTRAAARARAASTAPATRARAASS